MIKSQIGRVYTRAEVLRMVMKIGRIMLVVAMTITTMVYYGEGRYKMGVASQHLDERPLIYSTGYIGKGYWAEKTEEVYSTWNTTDELGIVLLPSSIGRYMVYILTAHEERALPWILEGLHPIIKYNDEFYKLKWLHVDTSLPLSPQVAWKPYIFIGFTLVLGWIDPHSCARRTNQRLSFPCQRRWATKARAKCDSILTCAYIITSANLTKSSDFGSAHVIVKSPYPKTG